MRLWPILLAGLAAAGVVLATCDEAPVTTVTVRLDDAWRFAQPAMPLLVEVRGRPYAADEAAIRDMVVEAMTDAVTWHADPRFTADPAVAGDPGTRVVVAFNPPRGAGGAGNCAGAVPGGAEDGSGTVRALASFCAGGQVLANVEGHIGKVDSEADGKVQALIRQIARDMFQGRPQP